MEILCLVMIISFTAGFLWGRFTTKIAFNKAFRDFTDEMHKQYVFCLKKKGIKIKNDQKQQATSKVFQN